MKLKPTPPEALWELLRTDFPSFLEKAFQTLHPGLPFLRNWHHRAIAWELKKCEAGSGHNLLVVNLPPRHLKSEMISAVYSAWLLGQDPSATIISLSYGGDLVRKLSRDTRKVMNAPWYKKVFPHTRISGSKNTETEFETTAGGRRYATTVNGELTGHGARYILIDDPHNVSQTPSAESLKSDAHWFKEGVWSRFEGMSNGIMVVLMQRYHPHDLTGYLVQDFGFRHLKLEAIAVEDKSIQIGPDEFHERKKGDVLHPEWKSVADLEKTRQVMGNPAFEAQYQQDPTFGGGSLYMKEYFGRYTKILPRYAYEYVVLTWDPASSLSEESSYTVCEVWGIRHDKLYLLRVVRDRREYPRWLEAAHKLIDYYGPTHILIENTSIGPSLYWDLRKTYSTGVYYDKPESDKLGRAEAYMNIVTSGRLMLPHSAPWLGAFEEELFAFPGAPHTDQIDAMNLFFKLIKYGGTNRPQLKHPGKKPSLVAYPASASHDFKFYKYLD